MKWIRGESYHPYEYRFFEGGGFPAILICDGLNAVLKTSFRTWLKFDQLIQASNLTSQERMETACLLCVEAVDDGFPPMALVEGLLWFHNADALDRSWVFDSPKRKNHKQLYEKLRREAAKKTKGLSLFWDTGALWSAFQSAFGIDLFQADLHWWAFMALMNELPENCGLNRLIRQRTTDIKTIDGKDRAEFLIRQHLAAVPAGGIFEGDHG